MEWTEREAGPDGRIEIRMRGDCDLYAAPRFKASILGRIQAGARLILIDMSELRYLDSTGVGAIIGIIQAVKRIGGDLRFRGVGGTPRRVLEMSCILPLMSLEPRPVADAPRLGGVR